MPSLPMIKKIIKNHALEKLHRRRKLKENFAVSLLE